MTQVKLAFLVLRQPVAQQLFNPASRGISVVIIFPVGKIAAGNHKTSDPVEIYRPLFAIIHTVDFGFRMGIVGLF